MKRVSCPKCGSYITFDENAYPTGRILVFGCPSCGKQFKIRVNPKPKTDEKVEVGSLTVIENTFHHKQVIPLYMGENIVGRSVKGTKANAAIITTDPSIDTTHCIINVQRNKKGKLCYVLRDAPSNTGTFYQDAILNDSDRINIEDESIITIGATTMIFKKQENK